MSPLSSDPDSEGDGAAEGTVSRKLRVPDADAGKRLDLFLAASIDALSRSRIQQLIRDGAVTLGSGSRAAANARLAAGETVHLRIPEPEPAEPQGEDIPLSILHEDDEIIVINKPAGLVVHPGAGNWTGTLVNALIHHCGASLSGIGGVRRPGIVHRLDKETSGVMVAAKTDRAHQALSAAFADHGRSGSLERAYLAAVWGAPQPPVGTIDAHLGRFDRDRTLQAVVDPTRADARHAVTHYETEATFGGRDGLAALIHCRLETGRTHQIRVHMAHAGHPVIGDPDYGRGFRTKANLLPEPARTIASTFPRQALHAVLLGFDHPATGTHMRFTAPLPTDMAELVAALRVG